VLNMYEPASSNYCSSIW